jgi:D-alanyl-D-alanine carboxypeptidase (penicillin-binding protein 5/6)
MELKFSGEVIATVDLVAVSNVGRSYWKYNIYALENFPHSPWFLYGILAGCVLTALYITLCIYAAYRARRDVTPEDPIHLIPHATQFQDRPKQNWKRDDTVFYHGPNGNENSEEKRTEKQEHYSQISKK